MERGMQDHDRRNDGGVYAIILSDKVSIPMQALETSVKGRAHAG